MNSAKNPKMKKTTEKSKKSSVPKDSQDDIGLLHELSGLTKGNENGIIRIEVDSRRR